MRLEVQDMVAVNDLFTRATVLENRAGNKINNVVYDRQLRLQLSNGQIVEVFDDNYPYQPLSTHVKPTEVYDFVIGLTTGTAALFHRTYPTQTHQQLGIIRDLQWVPPTNPESYYRWYGPRLYHNGGGFVVVQTEYFAVLLGPDDVDAEAATVSSYVTWEPFRYELLAVV